VVTGPPEDTSGEPAWWTWAAGRARAAGRGVLRVTRRDA
jgi:hypothetical protein